MSFMAKSHRELLSLQYVQRIENCRVKCPFQDKLLIPSAFFVRKIVGVSGQVVLFYNSSLEKRFNPDKLLRMMRFSGKRRVFTDVLEVYS